MNINYNFIVCREKAICNMLPFPVVECLLPNPGRSTPIQTSHPSLHVGYSPLQSSLDLLDFIFLHHPTTSQLWDSPLEKWLSTWSSHAWKPQWQQLLRLEGIKPNCSLGLWHSEPISSSALTAPCSGVTVLPPVWPCSLIGFLVQRLGNQKIQWRLEVTLFQM